MRRHIGEDRPGRCAHDQRHDTGVPEGHRQWSHLAREAWRGPKDDARRSRDPQAAASHRDATEHGHAQRRGGIRDLRRRYDHEADEHWHDHYRAMQTLPRCERRAPGDDCHEDRARERVRAQEHSHSGGHARDDRERGGEAEVVEGGNEGDHAAVDTSRGQALHANEEQHYRGHHERHKHHAEQQCLLPSACLGHGGRLVERTMRRRPP